MTNPQWTAQEQADADVRDALTAAQAAHGPVLEQLVSPSDPDWASYQSDSPDWFMKAAGDVIRKYCGWHIFPNIKTIQKNIMCGSRGIIVLPSRYITQVDSLIVGDDGNLEYPNAQWIDPKDYVWHEAGWIQRKGYAYYQGWYYSGYYYGNDPYYLPVWDTGLATCTFWHGYESLPDEVKAVAFELAEQAMAVRTGNVKMMQSPGGYQVQTSQNFGLSLNCEQMNRLANYRVGMVA